MVTQSLDDSLQPPAADSGSFPAAGRCQPPADLRQQVRQYDERAAVGTWSGPRYRMIHRTLGQGPALIWLPGIASTYRTYALVLNRLAEGFRTIQYEYPGDRQGDGARLGRITHDHLVDDLIGLMDHLDIGRAHLAGISFGSTIALKALERSAGAVFQDGGARCVCPSPIHGGGASGAVPGPAGARNRGAAAAAADDPRLQ